MIERTVDLGVRRPKAVEVKRAKQLLANAADPKRLNTDELYAQETLRLAEYPAAVNIKLQVLRIGDLGIVAIPCEVFAQIGLDIKRDLWPTSLRQSGFCQPVVQISRGELA